MKKAGGLFLVALTVPRVGATRIARCRPHTPVVLTVAVDVDVCLGTGVAKVDALPAVGIVAV